VSCACGVWIYIFRIYIAIFYSFLQIHTKREFCVLLFLPTVFSLTHSVLRRLVSLTVALFFLSPLFFFSSSFFFFLIPRRSLLLSLSLIFLFSFRRRPLELKLSLPAKSNVRSRLGNLSLLHAQILTYGFQF
jgi:hypothetical protein